jgi:hypothetical protein
LRSELIALAGLAGGVATDGNTGSGGEPGPVAGGNAFLPSLAFPQPAAATATAMNKLDIRINMKPPVTLSRTQNGRRAL